jgi:hypothetical protein
VNDNPGTPGRRRRFRRRGAAGIPDGATGQSLQEALAELVLLREENARLSAAAHEPPSLGRLIGQARSLGTKQARRDDSDDEAAQMFVEGVVLRETLLEVCLELERSIAAVKARLSRMDADTESRDVPRRAGDGDSPAARRVDLEDVVGGPAGAG